MSSVLLSRLLADVETLEPEEREAVRTKLDQLEHVELAAVEADELRRRARSLRDGTAVLHEHDDVMRDFLQILKR